MQFIGSAARPAAFSCDRRDSVHELLKHHRVMPVGARDAEHQRDTRPVRDEVALAAELYSVGRVEAGLIANAVVSPGGRPLPQSASTRHAAAKTQFLGQMLPGRTPVRKMPLSANSSLNRGPPPCGDFETSASSGCIGDHNAALTSCLTAIHLNDSFKRVNDGFRLIL